MNLQQVDVRFKIGQFLPAYRHLLHSTFDINLLWGGRGSGKSHFVAQKLITDCLRLPYFRCALIKKTYESIRDSQYQTLREIIDKWGLGDFFEFRQNPLEIRCINGNSFIARGCDNPGKLKSIRNPSHAWYEEGDQLSENDYIIASTTLRGPDGTNCQEWLSFNPECSGNYREHWLYKMFFAQHAKAMYENFESALVVKMPQDKTLSLTYCSTHTAYTDNPHCPSSLIARLESYKVDNPYYYKVFCLGQWGMKEVTSPFLFNFVYSRHVGKVTWLPSHVTYLSFDFNRNPICCSVWQLQDDEKIRCCEVIKLKNSDIYKLCATIASRYDGAMVIVTGDATGLNSTALVKDDLNFYDVIQQELGLNDAQIQLMTNPAIVENQAHCNKVFARRDILMDEDLSQPLIFDCQFAEIRADGKLKKENRDDPAQQLDALDTMRYFLNRFVD